MGPIDYNIKYLDEERRNLQVSVDSPRHEWPYLEFEFEVTWFTSPSRFAKAQFRGWLSTSGNLCQVASVTV